MCVYVRICMSTFMCLDKCMYVSVSVYGDVSMYMYMYMYVYVYNNKVEQLNNY